MTPEAMALAVEQASQDRATLARLITEGKVKRAGGHTALTRDMARRATPHAGINLAIRPNRKKKKGRK